MLQISDVTPKLGTKTVNSLRCTNLPQDQSNFRCNLKVGDGNSVQIKFEHYTPISDLTSKLGTETDHFDRFYRHSL